MTDAWLKYHRSKWLRLLMPEPPIFVAPMNLTPGELRSMQQPGRIIEYTGASPRLECLRKAGR